MRYVPLSLLDKGKDVLETIHDGDILAIVTRKKGLDTSHLGFAVWQKGCLHLLNASSIHKKVVLEPMTLSEYMKKHPSQLGVRWYVSFEQVDMFHLPHDGRLPLQHVP